MTATLTVLRKRGELTALDHAFARSLSRLSGEARPAVLLATALVSRQAGRGDVCLDLPKLVAEGTTTADDAAGDWPRLEDWLEELSDSPLVAAAGQPGDATPLVLDGRGRLYLRRYFEQEHQLADAFTRLGEAPDGFDAARVAQSIASLYGPAAGATEPAAGAAESVASEMTDWPRVAAGVAVSRRLCVISGGPGTGKTTTAARLLAVLVAHALSRGGDSPRIALAAPTGKAAARLGQAIARTRAEMSCADAVRDAIPDDASTLHRLLGLGAARHRSRGPVRERRLLRADIVLVDEASMIDLELMSLLVAALPPGARLILLGDADQLASVEAGAVFGDLCGFDREDGFSPQFASWLEQAASTPVGVGSQTGPIRDCVVRLQHSYRYGADSGIGMLATAIRAGDAAAALSVLQDPSFADALWIEPEPGRPFGAALRDFALAGWVDCFDCDSDDPLARLRAFDRARILCALREGPHGVVDLNRRVDAALVAEGLLPRVPRGGRTESAAGRPILVTRNAARLGLFNGDVGLLAADPAGGQRAWFEARHGLARSFAVSRLPPHETVFAMTVHKSQGSEFDAVALVLPDVPMPLLTRELVYTAVTRARSRVVVHASEAVLAAAIERRVFRSSGLREALWPEGGGRGTV